MKKGETGRDSIKTVISWMIILGLLIPLLILSVWRIFADYQKQVDAYNDDLERYARILVIGAQELAWNLDEDGMSVLIKSVEKEQRFYKIVISDPEGNVLGKLDRTKMYGQLKSSDKIIVEKVIKMHLQDIGTVRIEFSLKLLHENIKRKIIETIGSTLFLLLFCLVLIRSLINLKITRKIAKLEEQAEWLASKKLDTPFEWDDKTEIGSLGKSLEMTRLRLKDQFEDLEIAVEERTETINTILSNVKSGFFLVDSELRVCEGFTESCYTILSSNIRAGMLVGDMLKLEGAERIHFESFVLQVFDDLLPEEVSLKQFSRRIKEDDRVISIEGSVVRDKKGGVSRLLITVNDVSSLHEAELKNIRNQALIGILGQKDAFENFVFNTKKQFRNAIKNIDNQEVVRAIVHTIKGNASVFLLRDIASYIHEIEDKPIIKDKDIAGIEGALRDFLLQNMVVLNIDYNRDINGKQSVFEVSGEYLEVLDEKIINNKTLSEEIKRDMSQWKHNVMKKAVSVLFGPIEELVKRLSKKVLKDVEFVFIGRDTLVDPEKFRQFAQVLPHVIRNSIDHGIEPPQERGEKGARGRIELEVIDDDPTHWKINVTDDGRGIDRKRLVSQAVKQGLINRSQVENLSLGDVYDLMMMEGVSTSTRVNEISGRGFGMNAVKRCMEHLGGKIEVDSTIGEGTTFSFIIAKNEACF